MFADRIPYNLPSEKVISILGSQVFDDPIYNPSREGNLLIVQEDIYLILIAWRRCMRKLRMPFFLYFILKIMLSI